MARPAGYSSDEDFSGDEDDLYVGGIDFPKRRYNYQDEANKIPSGPYEKEERLIQSVIDGKIDDVKKYVNQGLNIDYKSERCSGWTALMHACYHGNAEIIKFLLENKASVSEHKELRTPLICLCGSVEKNEDMIIRCLDLLIDYGADINATDWYKANSLIHAVKKGSEKLVLKLINLGCNIECTDSDGWTPIFYAVDGGYLHIVQILKDSGADIKKIDIRGRNLHDIAIAKHHKEIAELVDTEEKNANIDEVINVYTDSKRMSNYEYILSELPDQQKGRFYGFHREAIRWLDAIGLRSLVNLFLKENVQLNELLTMDEDDLKNIGVELSYDRKKLRYCVQKLHEHSWGKNCLHAPSDTEEMNLNKTAQLLCCVIQQVHICSASTYFWRKNVDQQMKVNLDAYITKGLHHIKFIQKEKDSILKLVREVEQQAKLVPSDLIEPRKSKPYPRFKIIVSLALSFYLFKTLKPSLLSLVSNLKLAHS